MAGGLWERVKNWVFNENLLNDDLNSEFNNVIANFRPDKMDDYSASVTQMQVETSPGAVGTESLPTSTAGEIERLRYVIRRLIGDSTTYKWYSAPLKSIQEIDSLLATINAGPVNRISSGRIDADSQSMFLFPNGSARTLTLKGATTNLVAYINNVRVVCSTDITITNLTAAPSTNNTATVVVPTGPDSVAYSAEQTRALGEESAFECNPDKAAPVYAIEMTSAGTEITALIGKWAAFKLVNGSAATEYLVAFVESATRLTRVRRGNFFDSADAGIVRIVYSGTNTLTLMKLTYIFFKNDSTLEVTYTQPSYGDEPTSPSIGDMWFDSSVDGWKKYSGTAWALSNSLFVGTCFQSSSATIGARSTEFYADYHDEMKIRPVKITSSSIVAGGFGQRINVAGNLYKFHAGALKWDPTVKETGVTLSSTRSLFLYVKDTGSAIVSDKAPHDKIGELGGFYHPFKPWKCVGVVANDGTNFSGNVYGYAEHSRLMTRIRTLAKVPSTHFSAVTGVMQGNLTFDLITEAQAGGNTGAAWKPMQKQTGSEGIGIFRFMGRGQSILYNFGGGDSDQTTFATGTRPNMLVQTYGAADDAAIGIGLFKCSDDSLIQAEVVCSITNNITGVNSATAFSGRTAILGPLPEGEECYVCTAIWSNAGSRFQVEHMITRAKEIF